MRIYFNLHLPKCDRDVRIQISIPKNYENLGITFDSLYLLDGQNAFNDHVASFGRSMHVGRYLAILATRFNKRVVGIAIDNSRSDMGRVNEYTPFPLEGESKKIWKKQNLKECENYTYDFIHTIVPYIQEHFPVSRKPENTFIFGSSLGAVYASYIANLCPEIFGVAGIFSNAPFLVEKSYYRFLDEHLNKNLRNFLYVGLEESSDGHFDPNLYFNSAVKLHEYLKSHGVESKLLVDIYGSHNEETWEKHFMQFLSYIYFPDMEICI